MTSRAALTAQLRRSGFRVTAQRLAIAELLANSNDHPSARQIYAAVREVVPYISTSTVYNTLAMLVQCGFAQALPWAGSVRFEANLISHLHLVCTLCGEITDVPEKKNTISRLKKDLLAQRGFEIASQRLEFYGRCARCAGAVSENM